MDLGHSAVIASAYNGPPLLAIDGADAVHIAGFDLRDQHNTSRWQVAPDTLAARDGAVLAPDGRRLDYRELVSGVSLHVRASSDARPRAGLRAGGAAGAGRTAARGLAAGAADHVCARDAARRMLEESIAIANVVPERAITVILDERGENMSSASLAGRLQGWQAQGRPAVVFIIGGHDGLAPALREKFDLAIAFGAATWPHQLARIMLLEQLYRAVTILAGHPYHRA